MAASRLGSASWTDRSQGRLTRGEPLQLASPLLRAHLSNTGGRLALALRLHRARRIPLDPSTWAPPDSALARDADHAVQELVSPVVLQHSRRCYAFGAALGALEGITFDRELLYVAALFHDTGLESPQGEGDFTLTSARLAQSFAHHRGLDASSVERIADAICLHPTPGVTTADGPESYLLSAAAGIDVFGLRAWHLPDHTRAAVVAAAPRTGFTREFSRLWRAESRRLPRGRAAYLRRYALTDLTIPLAPFRGTDA